MKKYSILLKNVSYKDFEANFHYLEEGFWHFEIRNEDNNEVKVTSVAIISASEIVWIKID